MRNIVRQARRAIAQLLALRETPRLIVEFTAAYTLTLADNQPQPLKQFASERLAQHAQHARKLAEKHATLSTDKRHAPLGCLQDELCRLNDHVTAEALIKEVLYHRSPRPPRPLHAWVASRHALLSSNCQLCWMSGWLARQA